MNYSHKPVVGFTGRGSIPGLRRKTFVPRPIICPPLEKSCGRPACRPIYRMKFTLFVLPPLEAFCYRAVRVREKVRACVRGRFVITISYQPLVRISPDLQLGCSWAYL